MNDTLLTIAFVLDPALQEYTESDVREAREELWALGLAVETVTAVPEAPAQNTLYLTDSAAYYKDMCAAGIPTIGYLHAGNPGVEFPHCQYLISEPQWVDADSYHKIYERLMGLPWTILTTDRLIIREMTVQDLDALYDLYDEEARRYMAPLREDRDEERAELVSYIDKVYGMFGYGYWAITLRESGRVIGRMGLAAYEDADGRTPFGYVIHKDYRQQGYALEAAQAILPYATDVLQLQGISAEVYEDNLPSIYFLNKLGFRKTNVIENIIRYVL